MASVEYYSTLSSNPPLYLAVCLFLNTLISALLDQEFPSQVLVKYQTGSEEAAIQASFMNNLKEANHLKHGDGSKMNMYNEPHITSGR